jgi:hypothetical protein
VSRLGTHYLYRSSERLNNRLELEVIEEEEEMGDGNGDDTKGKEIEVQEDELGRLQCRGRQREQSEDCLFKFTDLIY